MRYVRLRNPMTEFLRYLVLIRVFDGDIDGWLHIVGDSEGDDAAFLRWLKDRCRNEPTLLEEIRARVDATGVWPLQS